MQFEYHINGGDFVNAGRASSAVKKILKQLNVPGPIIKRTFIALYKTEVNLVAHADGGDITALIDSDMIRIVVVDRCPGIEDIEKAMQSGFSTASKEVREMGFGTGVGLPNIKKNSDCFNISSVVGLGTRVEISNSLSN